MGSSSKQINFDERYVESLLLDKSKIQYADYAAGRELLLSYSQIPEEELPLHVAEIVSTSCGRLSIDHLDIRTDKSIFCHLATTCLRILPLPMHRTLAVLDLLVVRARDIS